MPIKYILVPMDRLGVVGAQSQPIETINFINSELRKGAEVNWLTKATKLVSEDFQEGHLYGPGTFLLKHRPELADEMSSKQINFTLVESDTPIGNRLRNSKIALYTGKGAAQFCLDPLIEVLDWSGFKFEGVDDKSIRKGALDDFDIFLVPGGPDAGESFYYGLGETGYNNIRRFVSDKGQYFGICAGAYLPLTSLNDDNPYWMGMVDATDVQELDYWRTGTGFVRVKITEKDHPFSFGLAAGSVNTVDMVYWEGPAMQPLSSKVNVLAKFDDFIASGTNKDYPHWSLLDNTPAKDSVDSWYNVLTKERFTNHMSGRAAMLETSINDNKILLYSPHAEFGNIGISPRKNSQVFQLLTNGLFYLGMK